MSAGHRSYRCVALALALVLAGMLMSQPAYADGPGGGVFNLMNGVTAAMHGLLQVFLGIGALGSVVMATISTMEGKPDSAKKFFYAIVAFVLGELLVSAFDSISSKSSVGSGTLLAVTMSVLQNLLCLVAMITVVGVAVKVMSADEQAVRRFFVWLIASVTGIILLNVFYSAAVGLGASI